MTGDFDPYHVWLGIPPADQPPHHYRLLGLALLEANPGVVDHAADRVLMHLRAVSAGPHAALAQRMINEVMKARICLLDAGAKARYDGELRSRMAAATAPPLASPSAAPTRPVPMRPVVAKPLPVAPIPVAPLPPPRHATPPAPLPIPMAAAVTYPPPAPAPALEAAPRSSSPRRRGSKEGESVPMAAVGVVKIVMGALGGLSMAVLIVWVGFRSDPLGLFQSTGGKRAPKKPNHATVEVIRRPIQQPTAVNVPQTPRAPTTSGPAQEDPADPGDASSPATSVAVDPPPASSLPVDPAPPRPVEPSPATNAGRRPQPTAEEQQAKLAELKEVYETEFEAANRPGTRETFPDFLLSTADRLKSDPVARFVLFREAFTRLIAQKQFDAAAELVDRLDQEFELDPFTLRTYTLTKASEEAKLPAEKLGIVLCAADLAETALARQRIREATTLVRMADGHARSLPDNQLRARIVTLRAEIEAAAEEWGPVERARQTLAATPEDAAAAAIDGRYRCLTLGDWQAGLPLLARSDDQTLAAAAVQDLAGPSGEVTAVALGDAWYEIGNADAKSAGCKARAAHWYRQAVEGTTGLDKVRLEKRLDSIAALNLPERLIAGAPPQADQPLPAFAAMFAQNVKFEPVNLFKFVQKPELLASPWNYDRNSTAQDPAIYSDPRAPFGRVPSHFNTSQREYQMSLSVVRDYQGGRTPRDAVTGPLVIGLVGPRSQFAVVLDYPLGMQYVSMLAVKDSKTENDNPTMQKHSSPLIRTGSSSVRGSVVICQVRRDSVSVTVDGQQACRFEGDFSKLVLPRDWSVNDDRAFIIGASNAAYFVSEWRLDPLAREAAAPAGGFDNPGFATPGLGVPPDAKLPAGLTPPGTPLPRGSNDLSPFDE